jgi:hypothetical protein
MERGPSHIAGTVVAAGVKMFRVVKLASGPKEPPFPRYLCWDETGTKLQMDKDGQRKKKRP